MASHDGFRIADEHLLDELIGEDDDLDPEQDVTEPPEEVWAAHESDEGQGDSEPFEMPPEAEGEPDD